MISSWQRAGLLHIKLSHSCIGSLSSLHASQESGRATRVFHSSLDQQTRMSSKQAKRKRRGKGRHHQVPSTEEMAKQVEEFSLKENDDAEYGLPAYSSMVYQDLIWTSPPEIKSKIESDPTYFHGRDGIASQWTLPSAVASQNEAMVAVFTRIQREQQLREVRDLFEDCD